MRVRLSVDVAVVAAGVALGAAMYLRLPEELPTIFNIPVGRLFIAFLLPTAAVVIKLVLHRLLRPRPVHVPVDAQSLAVCEAIVLRILVFLTLVHAILLLALTGILSGRSWAGRILPMLVGLTLISIGNHLPRTRPNLAIGLAIRTTLSDRDAWIRVHRLAGYAVVTLGAVIVTGALVLPAALAPNAGRLVEPAVLFGIPALVLYARRQPGDKVRIPEVQESSPARAGSEDSIMPSAGRLLLEQPERVVGFDVVELVLRLGAAGIFLGVGITKFESDSMWVRMFTDIGFGVWFRYFTGSIQVLGGLLLLMRRTAAAGALLSACTMAGAAIVHLFVLPTGIGGAIVPLVLLAFAIVVGVRAKG